MTRLLVVSSDSKWKHSLEYGLGEQGIELTAAETYATALDELKGKPASHYGAILVDGAASSGHNPEEVEREINGFVSSLRTAPKGEAEENCDLPILLWSSYPAEGLSRIASRFDRTVLLDKDTAETIRDALAAATNKSGKKADYASVELEIGPASLRVLVSVDGKGVITQSSRASAWRPQLQSLEEQFKKWPLWQRCDGQPPRYTDCWSETFQSAGSRLAEELDYDQLADAIGECLKHVDELSKIHFRFSVLSSDVDSTFPYVNVPFDLLYDAAKQAFVRSLAPVARRISLKMAQRTAMPLASAKTFDGRLLFIKSNASGSCEIPGTLFGGKSKLFLPSLESLDREFEGIRRVRDKLVTTMLDLEAGDDCIDALEDALKPSAGPPLEIIQFSGHSVRADDGSVYLMLPGREEGQLRPLLISDFAVWAREAKVQLVVLSSCESSRPDSVFRFAQVGVPAVVGFRWEVEENEAAFFTIKLQKKLAEKAPLARAFHSAIAAVKREYPGSPTFASPILVVQNDEWIS